MAPGLTHVKGVAWCLGCSKRSVYDDTGIYIVMIDSKASRRAGGPWGWVTWRKVNLQGDTGGVGEQTWSWAPSRPFVQNQDLWGEDRGLGAPILLYIHPAPEGDPLRNLGPQSFLAGNSFLFSTLESEPLADGSSKLAWAGRGAGAGWISIDLLALWRPQSVQSLFPPPVHQAPAEGKKRLPKAHIQPETSSCFHVAASGNAFDHLNPGCINSPNPFNLQGFSLMSNGGPFPGSWKRPVTTRGTGSRCTREKLPRQEAELQPRRWAPLSSHQRAVQG